MEDCNDIQLRESIHKNFVNLQEMIKFAETKNAAILASSGAVITLVFDKICFSNFVQIIFASGYIFVVIALIIAFCSFIPITHPDRVKAKIRNLSNSVYKNLFLYSDIASFNTFEKFETEIKEKYYKSQEISILERDVLRQIYTNAYIACRKLHFFRFALFVFLLGSFLIALFGPLKR